MLKNHRELRIWVTCKGLRLTPTILLHTLFTQCGITMPMVLQTGEINNTTLLLGGHAGTLNGCRTTDVHRQHLAEGACSTDLVVIIRYVIVELPVLTMYTADTCGLKG